MGLFRSALNRALPRTPLGDTIFTTVLYAWHRRTLPRFGNPVTFGDHLFELKRRGGLYDPLRQLVSDKHLVKGHVARVVGPDYVLETLDLLASEAEIDAYRPRRWPCVIKPTHLSGRVMVLRREGEAPDKALLKRWLRLNYYDESREPNYRHLRPRIMVEEYFADEKPYDFKILCFGGEPRYILALQRHELSRFYSTDWVEQPFWAMYPAKGSAPRPAFLEEMLRVARRLAEPFGFIRVDLLAHDGRLKVCELTNLPYNALFAVKPREYEHRLGALFAAT